MAVGLSEPGELLPVRGIRLAATPAGIKKDGQPDMVLIDCVTDTQMAGVFTRNAFCAAPVVVAREHLESSRPRWLLINSGNANAGTGQQGLDNARQTCTQVAGHFNAEATEVLPFSTGVINEQLPIGKLLSGIDTLVDGLDVNGWSAAARGIMTTDTVAKATSRSLTIGDCQINITGISKGSGMICPNMATMLAYVATDARVEREDLEALLIDANQDSFNSISVDGDTSTNDACILIATGAADNDPLNRSHPEWEAFSDAVRSVMQHLAQAIVRDGEGATKFIAIEVNGGRDRAECREVAYTVAHSPLVKTAFFASDPNLGRLLMAVGCARIDSLDVAGVSVAIDDVPVIRHGEPHPGYTEEQGQTVMAREEITVHVDLGRGDASATVWTSDLSYEYVRINAEYRS